MEAKTLETLEFNKILNMLTNYAKNELTANKILKLVPSSSYKVAEKLMAETDAAVITVLKYGTPEILTVEDVSGIIKRLKMGGTLSAAELLNTARLFKAARLLKKYTPEQVGVLCEYFEELVPNKRLEEEICASIISDEEIADNASSALYDIRRKIRNAGNKIKTTLDGMVRSAHYQKFLQDAIVTMRNNRYVVPVKAEFRSEIAGIVHDMSSSGSTVFIEPAGVVNANNELHELSIKEKAEIERILAELSQKVAEECDNLKYTYDALIDIDLVFAKAKLAIDMKGICPKLNNEGRINIIKGRHPLIDKKKIVPVDVSVGTSFDTLIVTGPNTGGKTVVLKTIGLFCLMAQAGLYIPASDESEIAVFENIFADIGDEQSIEQNLSTFSSHIKNIVSITEKVDSSSLVLFDELGAGTDPVEGAALAMAIIENMRALGARTVATTHYSELKLYALSTEGVENASCEFDVNTLSPTYRLLIGVPGKSNAFAISQKLGLSKHIIDRSKELLSDEDIKFEDVISDLEDSRITAEKFKDEQERMRREIADLKAELERERDKINKQKDKIYDRAREKAEKIITDAQEEVEEMLLKLREAQKKRNDEETKRAMEEVRRELGLKKKSNVPPKSRTQKNPHSNANINTLKLGSNVLIMDLNDKGTVVSINKKDKSAVIQVGIMKISSSIDNLLVLEDDKGVAPDSYIPPKKGSGIRKAAPKTEVDLRGMMCEEAELETEKFLDECVLGGITTASIIHGKGTGALRSSIHELLRHHPQVKSYRLGTYGEGENGVTIVELK